MRKARFRLIKKGSFPPLLQELLQKRGQNGREKGLSEVLRLLREGFAYFVVKREVWQKQNRLKPLVERSETTVREQMVAHTGCAPLAFFYLPQAASGAG